MKLSFILLSFLLFPYLSHGQDTTLKVGKSEILTSGANYYNYSNPDVANLEVILWGGARNPGKYLVPRGTTLIDLITLSGGPTKEYSFKNIRLIRVRESGTELKSSSVMNINYEDFLKKDVKNSYSKVNPILEPGDIIILPLEDEKTFWDSMRDVLAFVSPILSLALLVTTLVRRAN